MNERDLGCSSTAYFDPIFKLLFRSSDDEATADLDAAEVLIEAMGARRYQGLVLEGRGKLREALALYEELGATGHAKRVAQELAE